jgi:hypothetical protein
MLGQQEGVWYELLSEVYRLARDQDRSEVMHLLMVTRPHRGPLDAKDVSIDPELGRLSLGERKFMARGHNRLRLDRLLFDSEPSVVRNLLRNPHLTEKDVVRLAARRPTRMEIQKEIYQSRFGEQYPVRLALVFNPYTPTELSVKLLAFLLKKDLVKVKQDTSLHPLIREETKRLLAEKSLNNQS